LNYPALKGRVSGALMNIGGIIPFTTIDYPGALAAVLFCQGCPWRCPYCHNTHLRAFSKKANYPWPRILELLKERKGFLDAVVFSGGEPIQQPDLKEAIQDVQALGFQAGLHTAGGDPDRLAAILPLINWVGMDIKAPFDRYERITRMPGSGAAAKKSAQMIIASGISYEFRTTVHPDLISLDDLKRIVAELTALGAKHYAVQQFREAGCKDSGLVQVSLQNLWGQEFFDQIKKPFQTFVIRD
jgi:anaerobic ribonucleoside-triphosphate reductase activating protein